MNPFTYIVKEGFHTPSRRFVPGQAVSADDLAGPVPVDTWVQRGRIAPAAPEPVEPVEAAKSVKAKPPSDA